MLLRHSVLFPVYKVSVMVENASLVSVGCAAGCWSLDPAAVPTFQVPGEFLAAPPHMHAPPACSVGTLPGEPQQADTTSATGSSAGGCQLSSIPAGSEQQGDVIYVIPTSGSTGSAKAVCGTATGEGVTLSRSVRMLVYRLDFLIACMQKFYACPCKSSCNEVSLLLRVISGGAYERLSAAGCFGIWRLGCALKGDTTC
jgi:hypothetical protein